MNPTDNNENVEQTPEERAMAADAAATDAETARLTADLDDLRQTLLRRQADFDNYRKRIEKERADDSKRATARVVEGLIPVIDGFEHALAAHREKEYEVYSKGFELIYKQLLDNVSRMGVERLDPTGKVFDPHLHQAIMQVEDENFGSNIVVEEFQKGYILKDRVIRPAMVKVNQ